MNEQGFNFDGKTVLITGAATGIGKATALAFAKAKARIVIGDVDKRAEDTAGEIRTLGGQAIFRETDVANSTALKELVDLALSEYGSLDVAFNNAGVLPPTAPFAEQTEEDWHKVMNVDTTGVFLAMKHELAHMTKVGAGVIINTTSVAGLIADPGMAPYVAAKHAVVGLTRAAALDYAQSGVRVNAVAPGLIRTPMTERWLDDPEIRDRVLADSPIRRAAEPEEVAGVVLFLASDLASAVTGAIYTVDGGRTAH